MFKKVTMKSRSRVDLEDRIKKSPFKQVSEIREVDNGWGTKLYVVQMETKGPTEK